MRKTLALLAVLVLCAGAADARRHGKPDKHHKKATHHTVVHQVVHHHGHSGLPPGLAKRLVFAQSAPRYVVFDPRYDDRAWYLVDNRWVLLRGFDTNVRREVHQLLVSPYVPLPPPIPLPVPHVSLRVYLFG